MTPRSAWAMNGNRTEVKSPSGASTRAPSGSDAATSPASGDTWLPTATVAASTPTRRAKISRASVTSASNACGRVRPAPQSATAARMAAIVSTGGMPIVAESRNAGATSKRPARSGSAVMRVAAVARLHSGLPPPRWT